MNKEIIHILKTAKAILLDFDGTLVDSNDIKRAAFEKCFIDYPDQFNAIMAYCKGNNHIPRQIKFRHVCENILKLSYTPQMERQMLECYASETTGQVIAAREIPGATAFLERWVLGRNSALLSSTPHEVLLHILKKRKMEKFFRRVQGAPVDKVEWIGRFLIEQKLKPEEAVFIGDSTEDIQAAHKTEVPFIGVAEAPRERITHYLSDFEELK